MIRWDLIFFGGMGVAICVVAAIVALIWGGQGDGYHADPRAANETGGCLAIICLIIAAVIVAVVVGKHL